MFDIARFLCVNARCCVLLNFDKLLCVNRISALARNLLI